MTPSPSSANVIYPIASPRLTRLNGTLGSLLRIVEGTDVGPASQVVEAIGATARELEEAQIAWGRMR